MDTPIAIGIDLGTTNIRVGVWRNGGLEIIPNERDNRATPSYVSFSNERKVGDAAFDQEAVNPVNTIFGAKRLLGRRFDDPRLQADIKHFPFKVFNRYGRPCIQVEHKGVTKEFLPEEILAMLLSKIRRHAEAYLHRRVTGAVIAIPGYFSFIQRQAIRDAGTIAGLDVMRVISEPNSAMLSYGIRTRAHHGEGGYYYLVLDIGSGGASVAIVNVEDNIFNVIALAGDDGIGGFDIDNRLVQHFTQELKRMFKIDISSSPRALSRLRRACERAKRELSFCSSTQIEVESLTENFDFSTSFTVAQFEQLCDDIFQRTVKLVEHAVQKSQVDKAVIDKILFFGSSTRIPCVFRLVSNFLEGRLPIEIVNVDEAVAFGAAMQSAVICGCTNNVMQDFLLLECVAQSFGVKTTGTEIGLPNDNAIVPYAIREMIRPPAQIPTRRSATFSTHYDNQTTVSIEVYEGKDPCDDDYLLLGGFQLSGIIPAPQGVPEIEITLDFGLNDELIVRADDNVTGRSTNIFASKLNRLSKQEIYDMTSTILAYEAEDEAIAARLNVRNALEDRVYRLRDAVDSFMSWLEMEQEYPTEEYEQKMRDLTAILRGI